MRHLLWCRAAQTRLKLRAATDAIRHVSSFGFAMIHDALGEKEPALAALQHAFEDRAVEFGQMYQYPPFKAIASEPRFQAVMRNVNLPR